MTVSPQAVPCQEPDYRLELLDGEALLYDPVAGRLVHCNQMAAVIWQLCDGQRTVDEIVTLLQEAYPEATAQIRHDTLELFDQLLEAHAIRIA